LLDLPVFPKEYTLQAAAFAVEWEEVAGGSPDGQRLPKVGGREIRRRFQRYERITLAAPRSTLNGNPSQSLGGRRITQPPFLDRQWSCFRHQAHEDSNADSRTTGAVEATRTSDYIPGSPSSLLYLPRLFVRLPFQIEIDGQQDGRNKKMMLGAVHSHSGMLHELNSELNGVRGIGCQTRLLNPGDWIFGMAGVADKMAVPAAGIRPFRFPAECTWELRLLLQIGELCTTD
jgi:hypothetical protein